MSWYRVVLVRIGNQGQEIEAEEENKQLVLHLKVDEKKIIDNSQETFGYIEEWDPDYGCFLKCPLILEPILNLSNDKLTDALNTKVYYGAPIKFTKVKLSLLNKKLEKNEMIAMQGTEEGEDVDYTFKVEDFDLL